MIWHILISESLSVYGRYVVGLLSVWVRDCLSAVGYYSSIVLMIGFQSVSCQLYIGLKSGDSIRNHQVDVMVLASLVALLIDLSILCYLYGIYWRCARSVAPDHLPLKQLQWRHMGVMAFQINWSVLDRTTNKYCEWNPPVSRGFPSQIASNGENSYILIWGTIMMRTHYQQQCRRHDMDTLSASPFVNGIHLSPLVTHAIDQWCWTIHHRRFDSNLIPRDAHVMSL